jgi:hypothetical protein
MNRKGVEEYLISLMDELDSSGRNTTIYKDLFKRLSNDEFDNMMNKIRDGEMRVSVIVNNTVDAINFENNKKILKRMGVKLFNNLVIDGPDGKYRSRVTANCLLMPDRRVKQTISKSMSVGKDTKTRDVLTGTVAGKSSAGKKTLEEIKIMEALGLHDTITELYTVKGGDKGAENALVNESEYGIPELSSIMKSRTGVQSRKTLQWYLAGAHIKLTIDDL